MRVFVLIDNAMPIYDEPRTVIEDMQRRGWLDGDRITSNGYAAFDKASLRNSQP